MAMVGEEDVALDSQVNGLQEGAGENESLTPKGNFRRRPHQPKKVDPLISQLHTLRSAHGPDTPIGHRCSSLAKMIPIYKASTDAGQRAHLAAGMERKMGELKKLAAQFN